MIDINPFANFFLEPGWFQAFFYIWQNLIRYSVLILDAALILCIFFIFLKMVETTLTSVFGSCQKGRQQHGT